MRLIEIQDDDPVTVCRRCGGIRLTDDLSAIRTRELKKRLSTEGSL
jgi:hypothetical protein